MTSSANQRRFVLDDGDVADLSGIPLGMADAWNRGDAEGYASRFSETADFVAFEGTHLEGRHAITDTPWGCAPDPSPSGELALAPPGCSARAAGLLRSRRRAAPLAPPGCSARAARFTAFHREIFATVVRGSRITADVRFVRAVEADVAVIHAAAAVTLAGHHDTSPGRDSMQLFVALLHDGAWQVGAMQNARQLTLERQATLDAYDDLPPAARAQVDSLLRVAEPLRRPTNEAATTHRR